MERGLLADFLLVMYRLEYKEHLKMYYALIDPFGVKIERGCQNEPPTFVERF